MKASREVSPVISLQIISCIFEFLRESYNPLRGAARSALTSFGSRNGMCLRYRFVMLARRKRYYNVSRRYAH